MPIIDDVGIGTSACAGVRGRKVAIGLDGRIHCVYIKDVNINGGPWVHIFYAYSDDDGETWTYEDVTPGLNKHCGSPNIVVDSSGIPHIIYIEMLSGVNYGYCRYRYRSGGSWSAAQAIPIGFSADNRGGIFLVGETIRGQTSGATATLLDKTTHPLTWIDLIVDKDSIVGSFQVGERVNGLTSLARADYQGEQTAVIFPVFVIDANDYMHLALARASADGHTKKVYYLRNLGSGWSYGSYIGISQAVNFPRPTIGMDTNGSFHFVVHDSFTEYEYVVGTWESWSAMVVVASGDTNNEYHSMAVDLEGNVHVALQQTGLGGANPGVLNIHYYKRTAGVWGAVEHITDDAGVREDPSIAIDENGNIRVAFRGIGYGVNVANKDLVMRTKPSGGIWGAIQELTDRVPTQYAPGMLHALFPVSGSRRPSCPDGYALIWNGQDTLKVEYYEEIIRAAKPPIQMCLI